MMNYASFDPFAPPAHLTLELQPVENLFADSVSSSADELLYFPEVPQPPPMMFTLPPMMSMNLGVNISVPESTTTIVPPQLQAPPAKRPRGRQPKPKAAAVVDFKTPEPKPIVTDLATPVSNDEDEEEEYSDIDSDDDHKSKPRQRRAAAKEAALSMLEGSSSSLDEPLSGNKLKRKQQAAGIGAPPQRTQLTKAELELGATLELSRDELLNMTSDALEEHAKRLASQRALTPEEQKRFKRQRRLIKNRESAQLSRMRKKAYVDELERQISDLKDEKEQIRRRADSTDRQLTALRAETAQLRALLSQHPALASLASDRAVVQMPEAAELDVASSMPATKLRAPRRGATGGITLL